ncbi:hypothetical protein I317_01262 [Kwoniella heveanensis CBS 569]|nr:hypothetical protein I317_01262 [Kwoniella heveanensis CBS 569]
MLRKDGLTSQEKGYQPASHSRTRSKEKYHFAASSPVPRHHQSRPSSSASARASASGTITSNSIFEYDHLSLAVLLCMFISALWLLAAFTSASAFATLSPASAPSDLSSAGRGSNSGGLTGSTEFVEASIWGEVGLYELKDRSASHSRWRRIRAGEAEAEAEAGAETTDDKPADGLERNAVSAARSTATATTTTTTSNRTKRNEAVLEALSQRENLNKKHTCRQGRPVSAISSNSTSNNNDDNKSDYDRPKMSRLSDIDGNDNNKSRATLLDSAFKGQSYRSEAEAAIAPYHNQTSTLQSLAPRLNTGQSQSTKNQTQSGVPLGQGDNTDASSILSPSSSSMVSLGPESSQLTSVGLPTQSSPATSQFSESHDRTRDSTTHPMEPRQGGEAEVEGDVKFESEDGEPSSESFSSLILNQVGENAASPLKPSSSTDTPHVDQGEGEHAELVRRHRKHRQKQDQQELGGL